jgi:hypothetical protein
METAAFGHFGDVGRMERAKGFEPTFRTSSWHALEAPGVTRTFAEQEQALD